MSSTAAGISAEFISVVGPPVITAAAAAPLGPVIGAGILTVVVLGCAACLVWHLTRPSQSAPISNNTLRQARPRPPNRGQPARPQQPAQPQQLAQSQHPVGNVAESASNEVEAELTDEEKAQLSEDLRRQAQVKYGIDSVNHVNVCFAGKTGVGKTTLINAFRGLPNNDPSAARTSTIEESTVTLQRYDYPVTEQDAEESFKTFLKLWDVPGSGTDNFPWETYFTDLQLYVFDFIVIVCDNRIATADMELTKQAHLHEVPYAFVRSRADQAVVCFKNDTAEAIDDDNAVKMIRDQFRDVIAEKLPTRGIQALPQVFLISAYAMLRSQERQQFDEASLLREIERAVKARRNRTA